MALFIPALFAGARKIFAVVYDGDYLKHTGGPAGAADGTTGTIVWAGTFNSDGSAMSLRRVINGSGTVLSLRRTATNTIEFKGWDATAVTPVFSNVSAAVAASLGFLIIIATCNGTSSTLNIIHAAGTITGTNTPGTANPIDWTADWWYGQDGASGEFLDADTAMWWDDLTVVSNTEQFWDSTNDTLRDPGADGSNPLDGDHAPLVCHVNPAATHTVNRGSGGDADVGTTFEDGTSPGAYSPDFTPAGIDAVLFDTPTDDAFVWANPGISGISDGDIFSIFFWYKLVTLPSVTGEIEYFLAIVSGSVVGASETLRVYIDTDDKLKIDAVIGSTFTMPSTVTETLDGNWHSCMAALDADVAGGGAAAQQYLYRDRVDVLDVSATVPATNIEFTRPTGVGDHPVSGRIARLGANVANLWFDAGQFIDFSSSTNRDKFDLSGTAVDLGSTGSTPTGTAPRLFMAGDASAFPTNNGLGNNPTDNIGSGLITAVGPTSA